MALLMATVATCIALAGGCSGGETAGDPDTDAGSSANGSSETTTMAEVSLYFVSGERVVPVGREVPAGDLDAVATALLVGPLPIDAAVTTPSVTTEIPASVEVRSVEIEGSDASIDLSEAFLAESGSLSVRLRLAQLVYTLTSLGDVERVALSVEGEPVTMIGDGLEIENPLTREQYAVVAPEVLIESPLPGAPVASPVAIVGSTMLGETSFAIRITDPQGDLIAEEMLVSGSDPATFDVEVAFETSAEGTGSVDAVLEDGSSVMHILVPME
jgi:hypothetical protein